MFTQSSFSYSDQQKAGLLSTTVLADISISRHYEILYNLGIELLHCGQPQPAFDCLLETLQQYQVNPSLWLRLAECCIMTHRPVCFLSVRTYWLSTDCFVNCWLLTCLSRLNEDGCIIIKQIYNTHISIQSYSFHFKGITDYRRHCRTFRLSKKLISAHMYCYSSHKLSRVEPGSCGNWFKPSARLVESSWQT